MIKKLLLLFCFPIILFAQPFYIENPISSKKVKVQSWKEKRDLNIVKQDYDYSCGAASIATLLNNFYGQNINEKDILDAMKKEEMAASFYDMQMVLPQFGFIAKGYALSFDELAKIKIPVIVYLHYRKNNHFSVLEGINHNTVLLSDPSLGHISMSREQFIQSWHTTNENTAGKILAILPANNDIKNNAVFFNKNPQRQTKFTVQYIKQWQKF